MKFSKWLESRQFNDPQNTGMDQDTGQIYDQKRYKIWFDSQKKQSQMTNAKPGGLNSEGVSRVLRDEIMQILGANPNVKAETIKQHLARKHRIDPNSPMMQHLMDYVRHHLGVKRDAALDMPPVAQVVNSTASAPKAIPIKR